MLRATGLAPWIYRQASPAVFADNRITVRFAGSRSESWGTTTAASLSPQAIDQILEEHFRQEAEGDAANVTSEHARSERDELDDRAGDRRT